ncbi:MAG: hypothetical protein ACRDPT_17440 [Streptomycetales bacterium]
MKAGAAAAIAAVATINPAPQPAAVHVNLPGATRVYVVNHAGQQWNVAKAVRLWDRSRVVDIRRAPACPNLAYCITFTRVHGYRSWAGKTTYRPHGVLIRMATYWGPRYSDLSKIGTVAKVGLAAAGVVALGSGTAVASHLVTSAEIKNQTVRGVDVHRGAVGTSEARDHALGWWDIRLDTLREDNLAPEVRDKLNQLQGPQGEPGPQGDPGPAVASFQFTQDGVTFVCTDSDGDLAYECAEQPPAE